MTNSIESRPLSKPDKPYVGFPLFSHAGSGQWAKKVRGKLVYFGSWREDRDGAKALDTFNREWPYVKDGRTPPAVDVSNGCTLRLLVNDFLRFKQAKLDAGDLARRTFRDYYQTCAALVDHFGKERLVTDLRPDDFRKFRAKLAERLGAVRLKNEINRVCSIFNHAHENELIDKPVSYGSGFDRPSSLALRRERNKGGPKLFEREEVLSILGAADVQLKAMVLLSVNTGFGNSDIASLPESAVNLQTGWIDFPRPKTEIPRHVPLWKETLAALQTWLPLRPAPADDAAKGLVFRTGQGRAWVRVQLKKVKEEEKETTDDGKIPAPREFAIDALSQAFAKVLKKLRINGRRGLGFYSLRHNFETYAGESKDQVAVDAVMGHVDSSMSANYRHRISDERLQAVVETVRAWLFPALKVEGGAK